MVAAAVLVCAATTLSAQDYKYLTSVALFKVQPGLESAFVEKSKAFVPVLDKLLSSGTVLAYGMDTDVLHVPGETNVAFWYEGRDYAAIEQAGNALDEFIASNAPLMKELVAMTDMSAHRDLIVRAREESHKTMPGGIKPTVDFDIVRVKPGRMPEFLGLFDKYNKPVYEKLVADGVIYAYELDTEAVHTMAAGMVWTVVTMPNLGAKDKVNAAFAEADKKMTESERNMLEKTYYELVDPASHRDSLSVSQIIKQR